MTTICLNMIVKNESKIIKRLLDSCYKLLDYWVIVDTGSTDNTKQIINEYFKEKNIPGELHEKEFINFGFNRTHALKLAKNKADFLFFMDADHILNYNETFSKEQLKDYDEINIQLKTGILKYYLIRFLRNNMDIQSVGVTHEYYEYDKKNPKIVKFQNIWIDDYGDGGCRHLKFERDIKMLEESIDKEPNNSRNLFYLAESYRNSKQYEKAIEFYKKRAILDFFHEEKWFSIYMIGKCYCYLGNEKDMIYWCLKAYEEKPSRSEPLYLLAEYYQKKGKYSTSNIFCELGSKIKYPKNDLLFVEEDVYKFKFSYIQGVIYHYINKNASIQLNKALLLMDIPKKYYFNMLDNLSYYSKSLINELSLPIIKTNIKFNKVSESILNCNKTYYVINNLNPLQVKEYDTDSNKYIIIKTIKNVNLSIFNICTHFIKIDDIFIACVYYKYNNKKLHKIIGLDDNFNLKYISNTFYLSNKSNESIFELRYYDVDSIEIYWISDDNSSFKIKINKKTFNKYLFNIYYDKINI